MNKLIKPIRIFLGLFFVIFGLNGLVLLIIGKGFIPMPPPAESFAPIMEHLFQAKFVMPMAKLIQLGAGILLLIDKYINLALLILSPVIVSILAAHLVVFDLAGLPLGIIAFITWTILVLKRKNQLKLLILK